MHGPQQAVSTQFACPARRPYTDAQDIRCLCTYPACRQLDSITFIVIAVITMVKSVRSPLLIQKHSFAIMCGITVFVVWLLVPECC